MGCLLTVLSIWNTQILNNNAKHEARGDGDEKLRDQGFARPKVVIVVPFKESCRCIVELLMKMFSPENQKGSVANRKRFNEDYVKVETIRKDKPDDYYDTFQGDTDDSFKLGIAVTKKTIKLYTDFYSSDIIITSPLGLRLVTGVEGQGGKTDTSGQGAQGGGPPPLRPRFQRGRGGGGEAQAWAKGVLRNRDARERRQALIGLR